MKAILIGSSSSLFMFSVCILLLPGITNGIDIRAVKLNDFDSNNSLSSLNADNGSEILILNGATLIDGKGGPPKPNSMIVIGENKKIVAVTNQTHFRDDSFLINGDETESQITRRVINLTGKYVMPGLFDMHAHVAGVRKNSYDQLTSENMLVMLLNHGVTTIRNPGGPTNETVRLREEVLNGNISGPEIFTAGRLINTPEFLIPFVEKQVTTDEEVRGEVSH